MFLYSNPTSKLCELIRIGLIDAFSSLGELLGNLFNGDGNAKDFFSGIILIVVSFMEMLGKALIAAGVASEAFQTLFANPIAAIAAGIALIATAAIVRNLLKSGPQGLKSGGFVTEGGQFQLHKDELVSLPAGSAVTSQRTSRAMAGGGSLSIRMQLRQFIIELDRERERMNR